MTMLIHYNEIKLQFSLKLQKLIDYVLSLSSDDRPLVFCDAEDYKEVSGEPFDQNAVACLIPSERKFRICIEQLTQITDKEELAIAHELGHLWLQYHDFPREKILADTAKHEVFKQCFGPLLEIMEHAIFYPWLKTGYNYDLYKVGDQRLADFIKTDLPSRKITSEGDKVSLILNYIKFHVEASNSYWQEKLCKAYSKPILLESKNIAERVLPIIMQSSDVIVSSRVFTEKYQCVLELMNIDKRIWPSFLINKIKGNNL